MSGNEIDKLREHGINPSAQRVAIARYVLATTDHPSADQVWNQVLEDFPVISRATVYNTLNLFVEKGLLRRFVLTEGRVVFDPHVDDHHHFIDVQSGAIHDVPWEAVDVSNIEQLEGFDVHGYQVVLHGRKTGDIA